MISLILQPIRCYSTGATATAFHDKKKQAEIEIRRAQEQIASGRMQEENLRKQVIIKHDLNYGTFTWLAVSLFSLFSSLVCCSV